MGHIRTVRERGSVGRGSGRNSLRHIAEAVVLLEPACTPNPTPTQIDEISKIFVLVFILLLFYVTIAPWLGSAANLRVIV